MSCGSDENEIAAAVRVPMILVVLYRMPPYHAVAQPARIAASPEGIEPRRPAPQGLLSIPPHPSPGNLVARKGGDEVSRRVAVPRPVADSFGSDAGCGQSLPEGGADVGVVVRRVEAAADGREYRVFGLPEEYPGGDGCLHFHLVAVGVGGKPLAEGFAVTLRRKPEEYRVAVFLAVIDGKGFGRVGYLFLQFLYHLFHLAAQVVVRTEAEEAGRDVVLLTDGDDFPGRLYHIFLDVPLRAYLGFYPEAEEFLCFFNILVFHLLTCLKITLDLGAANSRLSRR